MNPVLSNAQKITGWMFNDELLWLAKQAQKSQMIVEAGSNIGRSTMVLADNCPGIVISVDPYSGPYYYDNGRLMTHFDDNTLKQFNSNLKHHLESHKVTQFRVPFTKFNHALRPDFIFLDGDHRYETVKADIHHAKKIIAQNGTLAGHDYTHKDWPGVKKAVDECIGKVNLVNSIWWVRV